MNTVFVSFPFDGRFDDVFEVIRDLASARRLNAVRADERSLLATPVADVTQRQIRDARLVIAEITDSNPNVLHEVGMAQALGKPLVLLTQEEPERAAFNVRSLSVIRYDPANLHELARHVDRALAEET